MMADMPNIYEQHEAAFGNVSAFVIAKDGKRVATIAFKFPRDGAGRLVAYVGKPVNLGTAFEQSRGYTLGGEATSRREVTTWMGDVLGTCTLGTGWRVNSYVGSRMYQIHARIAGREYTGRGFGEGMAVVLRETAASKRKRGA